MCGIAGYFGKRVISRAELDRALDSMVHRGPDGHGITHKQTSRGEHLYLLHARLSIIDLSPASNQPMHFAGNSLVFNGEIYNYLELKQLLIRKYQCSFQTASDTEVFLQALTHMGVQRVYSQVEGMFAFAFFDSQQEKLYIGRDFFGEKPLYYIRLEDGFYFASEIKTLISLIGYTPRINEHKLKTYLFLGYRSLCADNLTFFDRIESLPRNQILELSSGQQAENLSGYVNTNTTDIIKETDQAISATRDALLRAVEIRLRSDVPIAFCMSGGIDSLSLISIAKKIFNYDVHGFTISNKDERYDESGLVDKAVSELGVSHTYVAAQSRDFLTTLQDQIISRHSPVSTISYYVHHLLMSEISKFGYKVSISGTGADELFTGYYDHYLLHLSISQHGYDQALLNWRTYMRPFIRNPLFQDPQLFRQNPSFRKHLYHDYERYSEGESVTFVEERYHTNLLKNRMCNELFKEVVPVILAEDDMNSMSYSIENRSPFLDKGLMQASDKIAPELYIQQGYNKYILREAVKGILPEPIRTNRKKVGFNCSLFEVLPSGFSENPSTYFSEESPIFEYVNREKILSLFKNQDKSAEKFLFNVLNANIFLENFL